MDISENKHISLNLENCEHFIPKSEKNFEKEKLNIDLQLLEENAHFHQKEEISRRKASSDSTNISKIDDISELNTLPSESSSPQVSPHQTQFFFGQDKNCSNPIYNFYQSTEEFFQETNLENGKYKNSKNFPLKKNFFNKFEKRRSVNVNILSNNNNLNKSNNINSFNINPSKTLKNDFIKRIPNILNDGKGKFDMPIYYVGFYGLDSKSLLIVIFFYYFYSII